MRHFSVEKLKVMEQGTENNHEAILLGDIDHGRGLKMTVDDTVKCCVIYIENPTIVSRAY